LEVTVREGSNTGTWYEALRPDVMETLGIELPVDLATLFPAYQKTDEYRRYLSLTEQAAPADS
jgi:hypothetical protein